MAVITKRPRFVVIAPMASGKTTAARNYPNLVADIDASRDPRYEDQLKELRRLDLWPEHNAIWHRIVRRWIPTVTQPIVMVHSYFDAQALFPSLPKVAVLPNLIDHRSMMESRNLDPESLRLAELNRADLEEEVATFRLDVYPSITEAIRHLMYVPEDALATPRAR